MAKSLNQLLTAESISLIKKTLAEALVRDATDSNLEIPPPIDVEAYHRDGTTIWLQISRVFMRDENNTPIGVLGVARDISDRVRATLALKESEAKYRALAEKSVPGIVIAQDYPVRLPYVNDTMEEILGYSKEEMTRWRGEETARLIYPEDRTLSLKRLETDLKIEQFPGHMNSVEFEKIPRLSG